MPEMTPEAAVALRAEFPAHQIGKLPRGSIQLDYVGHAAVTDRLLQVDPAWTWEPLSLDENGLPAYDRAGGLWIRLTVCGVTRLGYGDGPDPKQRIGDALRNAAMRFGVALDLWHKGGSLHDDYTAARERMMDPGPYAPDPEPPRPEVPTTPPGPLPAPGERPAPKRSKEEFRAAILAAETKQQCWHILRDVAEAGWAQEETTNAAGATMSFNDLATAAAKGLAS